MIDTTAKLQCITRELKLRKGVYPKLVARKQMREAQAFYEIRVMEAIERDYLQKLANEQVTLPLPD